MEMWVTGKKLFSTGENGSGQNVYDVCDGKFELHATKKKKP